MLPRIAHAFRRTAVAADKASHLAQDGWDVRNVGVMESAGRQFKDGGHCGFRVLQRQRETWGNAGSLDFGDWRVGGRLTKYLRLG